MNKIIQDLNERIYLNEKRIEGHLKSNITFQDEIDILKEWKAREEQIEKIIQKWFEDLMLKRNVYRTPQILDDIEIQNLKQRLEMGK